jgi:urease accessory protein
VSRQGHGSIVCRRGPEASFFEEVRAESPLRFLLPKPAGCFAASVCFGSFGGGLVGGDALDIALRVEEGATLLATTQASTKAFRGETRQSLRARVDGTLLLLPDPVSCFAGASYGAAIDIELGERGSLVLVDAFTSGRAAYGERWAFTRLESRIHVTRGKKPVVRDAIVLDGRHGAIDGRFGVFDAFATVLALGPQAASVVGSLLEPAGASPLYAPSRLSTEAGAIVRILGDRSEAVTATLRSRLDALVDLCGIDPYASRW